MRALPSSRRIPKLELLGCLGVLALACQAPASIPTYEVARRDFVHRVVAEGFLAADDATQVVIPRQVRHGGRILWMATDGSEVAAGEVVMRLDHYELEQQLEKELADLQVADLDLRRTAAEGQSSIEDATTRKDLAGLELEHAEQFRLDDDQVFSRNEIIGSHIEEELARSRRGRAADLEGIEAGRAQVKVERVDVDRRVADLEVELARAALRALELRAPRDGILQWTRDWRGESAQIGEQVFRGQVMAEISDLQGVEAEVFVLEADGDGVEPGKPATITIDARPDRTFSGRVARVDPIARRRFRGSPVQYFRVKLALEAADAELMKPGQRLTASILVGSEPKALVVPRIALFADRGGYFVYVARDGAFSKQSVLVRDLGLGAAWLEDGVGEGDAVALQQPVAKSDTNPRGALSG